MLIYLSGEFTFFGYSSSILFKIVDENTVHLECISTPSDNRRQGSASSLMKAIADIAENTKTKISLTACNVTGNGWMMMQHLTISHGMSKQNKIPVAKLKSWYEKFGFKPIEYSKKHKGWNMEFIPSV
jgi:GNAT superfamily N-acetyltransferase